MNPLVKGIKTSILVLRSTEVQHGSSSQVTEKAYQTQEVGITTTEGRIKRALTRKGEKTDF